MAGHVSKYEREVRDTVLKSSLTGVAATALAITVFSPAGFGDWVGATFASSLGYDTTASAADNPYANLPAYPAPLTEAELSGIRSQLTSAAVSLELTRLADEAKIEHFRSLELTDGVVTFTPAPRAPAAADTSLRLTLSEPASLMSEAPVESYVMEPAAEVAFEPASYSAANNDPSTAYRDPHLELADLLLAHENS